MFFSIAQECRVNFLVLQHQQRFKFFAIRFTSSLLIACYPHIKQRIIVFRYWSLLTSYSCVILQNSIAAKKFDTRFSRVTPDSQSSPHPSKMDHAWKQK